MQFQLDQAVEVLSRTPGVLRAMLTVASEPWVRNNYGPDTFSPFDVVGHLIHGEKTDWMARARIILEHGVAKPFAPFDRYAMFEVSKGQSIDQLLDEFELLRTKNVSDLTKFDLTPTDLDRKGTHPALGTVTLRQLLSTWVVHDLGHLHQIAKCMAWQYRENVGPWKEYLTILPRE